MSEKIEREIRSIRRQHMALKSPIEDLEQLDPLSEPQGLRVGSDCRFSFPHEGILDAVLNFAQSVWHFKDYLKDVVPAPQRRAIEAFGERHADLKICADLANEKKHSSLRKPRSKMMPQLGLLSDSKPTLGVVAFDTSRNGMVEFAYNGKTKQHRFWVSAPLPIPWHTEIIVSSKSGAASKGDAVDFIFGAFRKWEPLIKQLGIRIRPEFVG